MNKIMFVLLGFGVLSGFNSTLDMVLMSVATIAMLVTVLYSQRHPNIMRKLVLMYKYTKTCGDALTEEEKCHQLELLRNERRYLLGKPYNKEMGCTYFVKYLKFMDAERDKAYILLSIACLAPIGWVALVAKLVMLYKFYMVVKMSQ